MENTELLDKKDEVSFWFESGVKKLKGGDKANALRLFLIVLEYWPRCAEVHNNIGYIFFEVGNYSEACHYFLKSLEIYPGNHRFLHNVGMCYAKLNEYEKAVQYYREAIAKESNYAHSYYNLAGIYRDLGHYDRALPLYEHVANEKSDLSCDAQYMIDCIKGSRIESAPEPYLIRLFDQYSSDYDEHMYDYLSYNSASQFGKILESISKRVTKSLDIGCGTGEVGKYLCKYSQKTIGIDLSKKMLKVAQSKGYYNLCIEGNFLEESLIEKKLFDCVTLCDVMIYFGNIEVVLKRINRLLKSGGDFIFNFENGVVEDYKLDVSGRFVHNLKYVHEQLEAYGFTCLNSQSSYSRIELQKKVSSVFIYACKKVD